MLVVSVCGAATNTFTSAYISEFLADNQGGLKDDTGERSPWIELYNGAGLPVALRGIFAAARRSTSLRGEDTVPGEPGARQVTRHQ